MFGVYCCEIYKLLINDIKYIISLYHYQKMTQPDWLKSSHILLFKNAFLILILSDDFLPEKSGTDKILCHLKCCIIRLN